MYLVFYKKYSVISQKKMEEKERFVVEREAERTLSKIESSELGVKNPGFLTPARMKV